MELVQRIGAAAVHGRRNRVQQPDGRVGLHRIDGPDDDAIGKRGQETVLDVSGGDHADVQALLQAVDLGLLGGRYAQGIETHGDELRDATVVVVTVVLQQLRHRLVGRFGIGLGRGVAGGVRRRDVRCRLDFPGERAGHEAGAQDDCESGRSRIEGWRFHFVSSRACFHPVRYGTGHRTTMRESRRGPSTKAAQDCLAGNAPWRYSPVSPLAGRPSAGGVRWTFL